MEDAALLPSLFGALPGVQTAPISDDGGIAAALGTLVKKICFTGHPRDGIRLESLLHALGSRQWAWIVMAEPAAPALAIADAEALAREEREIRAEYMRPGTIEAESNPRAESYLSALTELREQRLECARSGGWIVSALLLAEDVETLRRGVASLGEPERGESLLPPPRFLMLDENHKLPGMLLTTNEAALLAQLPNEDLPGFERREPVRFGFRSSAAIDGGGVPLGMILDGPRPTGHWYAVPVNEFSRHCLITGMSGAGKSHTCQWLLKELWGTHQISFLVLDAGFNATHRSLLNTPHGAGLHIFTLANEEVVPFPFSLFSVPPTMAVQSYIDGLFVLLAGAFGLPAPLPFVLRDALCRVYQACGWDLHGGARGCTPRLADLIQASEAVAADNGWRGELLANIEASLLARLRSLGLGAKASLFDAAFPIEIATLLARPVVLEMSALADDDEKAVFAGALLLQMQGHWLAQGPVGGRLRHLTLVEEAHRLLRRAAENTAAGESNPRGRFLAMFSQLLAEIRTYGDGWIFSDQMPAQLAPEIIKNTVSKSFTALQRKTIRARLLRRRGWTKRNGGP